MKQYDFKKAKKIISENLENLQSASLGMHEDWFWTAETIWEQGVYIKELPDNADELEANFIEATKNGLSIFLEEKNENGIPKFNPEYDKYQTHKISGIYGSYWATPTLQLCFKNETEKMIEVSKGESNAKPAGFELGVLSQPVQDTIAPNITFTRPQKKQLPRLLRRGNIKKTKKNKKKHVKYPPNCQ